MWLRLKALHGLAECFALGPMARCVDVSLRRLQPWGQPVVIIGAWALPQGRTSVPKAGQNMVSAAPPCGSSRSNNIGGLTRTGFSLSTGSRILKHLPLPWLLPDTGQDLLSLWRALGERWARGGGLGLLAAAQLGRHRKPLLLLLGNQPH